MYIMPNEANNTAQNAAEANWEALTSDEVVVATAPVTEQVETPIVETPAVETPIIETPAEPAKPEEKAAETPTEELPIKLDVTDLTDVPVTYEEGTWQKVGQELGLKVEKEDFDTFKQALNESFVPKSEFEKIKDATVETLYGKLDPKLATAFKMIDLGIEPELALTPTKQHDYLLSLDSATLLRMKLESNPAYDADMVDAQLEEWAAGDKLETMAKIEKAQLAQEKATILNKQSEIYQQLQEQRAQHEIKAKQDADQKFFEALNNESAFLGVPLTKEVKAAIEAKYRSGSYDKVLNEAQNKVRSIMQAEFGSKFQEIALKKAEEKGKAEIVRKLSDVPVKTSGAAGRAIAPKENETNGLWDALL